LSEAHHEIPILTRYGDLSRDEYMTSEYYQVGSSSRPIRERVGLAINGTNAAAAVETIVTAEDAGVRQIWMVQPPNLPDTLTTFSAAAAKTSKVKLGTSIVPTYPRHPLVLAQQALAIHDLAPDRLRLGIGPSHRFLIENMY
jgi:alkanesulfonate monooxygenase SsuD/methylene tetrahydromethanopterin reductase-like flavin-dependent oxidoreductase (luciferase family)